MDSIYDENIILTTQDLRTCRYCAKGTQSNFLDRGYDWRRFVRHGLPWSAFTVRDELEKALYQTAMERERGHGECEEHAAKGYDRADIVGRI